MPSYLKLADQKVVNANAAYRVNLDTPETRAIGRVPGRIVWFDAEHIDQSAGVIRNRARANRLMEMPFVGTTGTFAGGEEAISSTDTDPLAILPEEAINPNEWSAVFVVKPITDESRQTWMNSRDTETEIAPHIGLSSSGNTVYVYQTGGSDVGQAQRLSYLGNFPARLGPSLVTITFSTTDGLRIYDGRTLAASDVDDKDPLGGSFGAGEWEMMRFARGLIGMGAVLNIDLSKAVNAPHFTALQDWLIDKYDVTLP